MAGISPYEVTIKSFVLKNLFKEHFEPAKIGLN